MKKNKRVSQRTDIRPPEVPAPPAIRLSERAVGRCLLGVLLLAFALRFAFFYQMAKSPISDMLATDSQTYNDWARALAGGDWLGKAVFFASPLYPYLLGLVYRLVGYHLHVALFLQIVLGTLNCLLLFILTRKLFNAVVALIAALMMAAYLPMIVYDVTLLPTVLVVTLELCLALYLLHIRERERGAPQWLGAGVLAGLGATAAAQVLALVPLVLLWLAGGAKGTAGRRRVLWGLAFLAGFFCVIGTVTVRNWVVGRDIVPLTAHSGINFYIGNNPDAQGVFEPPPVFRSGDVTLREDSVMIAQNAVGRSLKPSEVSRFWTQQAQHFIVTQPGRFVRLLWRKLVLYWDGGEIPDVIHPYFFKTYGSVLRLPLFIFPVVAPLALSGIFLSLRLKKRPVLLYLFLLALLAGPLLYFVNARYRLVSVPFLFPFAGFAVYRAREMHKNKEGSRLLASGLLLLLFVFFVNPGLLGKEHERFYVSSGAGHNHIAHYYEQKGELPLALEEYQKALDLEPEIPEAHSNVANAYFRLGDYDRALKGYADAIAVNPYFESAYLNSALIYEKRGEQERAKEVYRHLIRILPQNGPAYIRLSRLLFLEGRPAEAAGVLREALRHRPGDPVITKYLERLTQQGPA